MMSKPTPTEKDMERARVACLSMRTWAVPPEDQAAVRCMVAQAIADERDRVLKEVWNSGG